MRNRARHLAATIALIVSGCATAPPPPGATFAIPAASTPPTKAVESSAPIKVAAPAPVKNARNANAVEIAGEKGNTVALWVRKSGDNRVTMMTRMAAVGPFAESYHRNEFRCDVASYRLLGEGMRIADANSDRKSGSWGGYLGNSLQDRLATHACNSSNWTE